jgi:pimeloyl-ACP methyl ester carboxylesterase
VPRTAVFVHGAWVTSPSWSEWQRRFEGHGYRTIAPAWPYDDRPAEALRAAPNPALAGVGIGEIVEHYAAAVRGLDEPPILVGHSFGGLFVQMLLDRGLGAAGVAIDPAPPRGVLPGPSAIRASLPVLMGWNSWREVRWMSFERFQWGWVHTLSAAEQRAAYDEFVVPTPGRIFLQALLAPVTAVTKVNFGNAARAPLLIIAGALDRTVEARMNRANFERQRRSGAVTDFREFPGRTHWIFRQPGWEEVADYALDWLERQKPRVR